MPDSRDKREPSRQQAEVDSDLAQSQPHPLLVLAAISAGGVLGAEARYGLGLLIKHGATGFPVSTVLINVSGSLLLGVLMAVIACRPVPALTRPFLGVGVLGGFTTFSTFAVDAVGLSRHHHATTAAVYLVVTVVACAIAVVIGDASTRSMLGRTG